MVCARVCQQVQTSSSGRLLFPPSWLLSEISSASEEGVGSPLAILSDNHHQDSVTQALPFPQKAPPWSPLGTATPMGYPSRFSQRSRTSRKERCIYKEIYCKKLAYVIVGAGKSGICRAGQAGNSWARTDAPIHRHVFFHRETSVLSLRPSK